MVALYSAFQREQTGAAAAVDVVGVAGADEVAPKGSRG